MYKFKNFIVFLELAMFFIAEKFKMMYTFQFVSKLCYYCKNSAFTVYYNLNKENNIRDSSIPLEIFD